VFVANALNVVFAITVLKHRRAFQRLDGSNLHSERLFQVIARGDGSGRARGRDKGSGFQTAVRIQMMKYPLQRWAGYGPVNDVVSVFRKLIQNQIVRIPGQRVAGVVNLLDVAFGPRGSIDVIGVGQPVIEPVKSLLAHSLRQHGNGPTSKEV